MIAINSADNVTELFAKQKETIVCNLYVQSVFWKLYTVVNSATDY